MSVNPTTFKQYLEYLPEREGKALEEAVYIKGEPENVAISVVEQLNRRNPDKNSLKPEVAGRV